VGRSEGGTSGRHAQKPPSGLTRPSLPAPRGPPHRARHGLSLGRASCGRPGRPAGPVAPPRRTARTSGRLLPDPAPWPALGPGRFGPGCSRSRTPSLGRAATPAPSGRKAGRCLGWRAGRRPRRRGALAGSVAQAGVLPSGLGLTLLGARSSFSWRSASAAAAFKSAIASRWAAVNLIWPDTTANATAASWRESTSPLTPTPANAGAGAPARRASAREEARPRPVLALPSAAGRSESAAQSLATGRLGSHAPWPRPHGRALVRQGAGGVGVGGSPSRE
jgi:hypothetical protein